MSNWNNGGNRNQGNYNARNNGGNYNNFQSHREWSAGSQNNQNRNNNGGAPFKRSGYECVQTKDGKGVLICSGWRKTKAGLQKLYARPYKGTHETVSKSGKHWLNYFVTITNTTTLQVIKTSGLLCVETKQLFIGDLNLIGSPNGHGRTSSGKISKGFFGFLAKS